MNNFESSPIAIVSMSGIFPQASDCDQFWNNIRQKVDATRDVSPRRWAGPFSWMTSKALEVDKAYSRRACLIDNFKFDPTGFNIEGELLQNMDPLCQWVLQASRAALAQTQCHSINYSRIGVILAAIALPTEASSSVCRAVMGDNLVHLDRHKGTDPAISLATALSGRVVGIPAAMVSQGLGLGGTNYTLDAACASSLYSLKLACDELQSRRADAMISGGVSRPDSLYTQVGFSQLHALSPSGRCAPFDRSADGLVVGEGVGIMVLKRLEDAVAHGDTIYGVIRGIGISNDMRGNLLAPESDGQLRALRSAYDQAGWHPHEVDYIECHGTGTPVGDATELQSLRSLWGEQGWHKGQCAIGSVKSMIGHLLTGAGAAGMIKTLLGLYHKTLPPSLKFEKPKPGRALVDGPFRVQTDSAAWAEKTDGTPRKAAVSAFGFGGINAHVLIEEFQEHHFQKDQTTGITIQNRVQEAEGKAAIAIVGMDLRLGVLNALPSFQDAIFNGRSAIGQRQPHVGGRRGMTATKLKNNAGEILSSTYR